MRDPWVGNRYACSLPRSYFYRNDDNIFEDKEIIYFLQYMDFYGIEFLIFNLENVGPGSGEYPYSIKKSFLSRSRSPNLHVNMIELTWHPF